MATDIATAILKNVDAANAASGTQVAAQIALEAERRPKLKGSIVDINWNRTDGIGIEVDGSGHREHLANSLGLKGTNGPAQKFRITSPAPATGYKRTGEFAGHKVTVWNREY
jgi:hypothetical protein